MIPCKKTQPPKNGRYIAQFKNGQMEVVRYCDGKWNAYYNVWGEYVDKYEMTDIVAWTHLPEPWRDEE